MFSIITSIFPLKVHMFTFSRIHSQDRTRVYINIYLLFIGKYTRRILYISKYRYIVKFLKGKLLIYITRHVKPRKTADAETGRKIMRIACAEYDKSRSFASRFIILDLFKRRKLVYTLSSSRDSLIMVPIYVLC